MPFFKKGKRGGAEKPEGGGGDEQAAPLTPSTPEVRAASSRQPQQLPPSPPQMELPAGAYASSEQHLWDELRRVDQLVRAQTIRWRRAVGESKPDHLWGMINVTDAEVSAYLQSPFAPHDAAPSEFDNAVAGYWRMAETMAESIRVRVEGTPPEVRLRLEALTELFGLSPIERDCLLICLLPEMDGRYRRLFGYLQDDASRPNPSVELVHQTLSRPTPDPRAAGAVFARASSLIKNRLVVLGGDAESYDPMSVRSVRVDDRVAAFLTGGDAVDGRLEGVVCTDDEAVSWDELVIDEERLTRLRALGEWWQGLRDEGGAGATLFLHGPYGSGRLAAARALCTQTGTPLLVAGVSGVARSLLADELLIDLAFREARLRGAALYWSGCEQLLEADKPPRAWEHLVAAAESFEGLTFLESHAGWEPAGRFRGRHFLRLDFPVPHYELRKRLWTARLPSAEEFDEPPAHEDLAEQLANGFQLTEGQIIDAVTAAREHAIQRDPLGQRLKVADLYEGCRRQTSSRLITFARRIESPTGLTFDDLILPPPNKRQLDELRRRIAQRHRVRAHFENRLSLGKGLITLFTGSSGTGKTMTAGLLALEQGVDLYKIDLSAVVSKYVGETEKNLNRVFAEAEDANAILFFDEGEALFGQRSNKTESSGQDRWANMEVNFLLQRVEEYTGVVIIASNLRQNIDEAFVRRIHVIVEFPFPNAEARLSIWRRMFPPGITPPDDGEIKRLSEQFNLSGGQISNIVVDAAFRAMAKATEAKPEITTRHLALAIAREYQKTGRPITEGEFGEEFYKLIKAEILLATIPTP